MAPPIIRTSRRWEPGLHVIRDGETSPTRQASASSTRGFRLILVGPATVFQHPETFKSQEKAERMQDAVQRQLIYGRDLVGHGWELTDLFPCGRTIVYLPSVRIHVPRHNGSAFRYNYFVSDADRFPALRSLRPNVELRIGAMAVSYRGRLQWRVNSMEKLLGA